MRILGAALIVLAGGALPGCAREEPAPPPPPPPLAAKAPAPPAPKPSAPVPFDPASATATLLVHAGTRGELPKMRPIKLYSEPKAVARHGETLVREDVVAEDGHLANVFAWVSKGAERWTFPVPKAPIELALDGYQCIPHVIALQVGQPLRVTCKDRQHEFHIVPAFNSELAQLLREGESLTTRFEVAEVAVKINGCDVHGWMEAWAGVFSHPFHGVTDHEGVTAIRLPPGTYEISVWHEFEKFTKPAPRTVTLAAGDSKEVEFLFEAK